LRPFEFLFPNDTHLKPRISVRGLLLLGALIHFGFSALLTLSVDEAHYALYAQHLALSYFDHPPLVGWVQWPLVYVNAPDWVLRLIPQACWWLASVMAWHLAEKLRLVIPSWSSSIPQGAAGRWAVIAILVAPVMHVLGVGLLPDTLLLVIVLGIMHTTLQLITANHAETAPTLSSLHPPLKYWLFLGIWLGLAGLSKYTAVLFAVAVAGALVINLGWKVLLQRGPWVAALIAGVMISPVIIWNAQHDWVSFAYQLKHSSGGTWQLKGVAVFAGLQIAAFGPLIVAIIIGVIKFLRLQPNRIMWGLSLFLIVPFVVTAYMAGGGRTLAHWLAPAWLAAIVLGANPLALHWQQGKHKALAIMVTLQATLCGLAFVMLFFVGVPGLSAQHPLHQKNPLADLWGWDQAGQLAQNLAQQQSLDVLTVSNWTLASRLAWYARPLPVQVLDDRFDQFDIWFGNPQKGQNTLFVKWSQVPYEPPVSPQQYARCIELEQLAVQRLGRVTSQFTYYRCEDWQGDSK
jgi:4-amino-4-deoxy-L-arabinose transferase-like glycosyltransferase